MASSAVLRVMEGMHLSLSKHSTVELFTLQYALKILHTSAQMLEEDAMFRMQLPEQLAPTWKMLLLSDGSVTRHLQLLTGQHIEVVTASDSLAIYLAAPCWQDAGVLWRQNT